MISSQAQSDDLGEMLESPEAIPQLTDQEFNLFQDLIYKTSGIYLGPYKKARLLWKVGKRMREVGQERFRDFYDFVVESGPAEIHRLLETICTHETHFFREPMQMEFFEKEVIPGFSTKKIVDRKVRIWSAGCSTGEEPYTLAMLLLEHLPIAQGWKHEILATDLSRPAVEKARRGVYPIAKAQEVPFGLLKTYMLRGVGQQQGQFAAGPEIRDLIQFDILNLNDEEYAISGIFDVIFCRNVMIYFSTESRERVVNRLLRYLAPGGYLFLGHAETLHTHPRVVRSPVPAVYIHRP